MAQLYGNIYETGKPSDWKPLACTKQADGTYVLKVDTELSVDSMTLEVNNIKVGSTDQTAANAKYLKTKADGTVYVEGTITGDVEVVQDTYADLKNQSKLVDSSEAIINPATEDKQDTIIGHVDDIEGKLDTLISGASVVGGPAHYNGTANLLSATVNFAGTTKHVQIENIDSVKDLFVSFDSGVNWRTIQPGYVLDLDCAITSLDIKASADGCAYEILSIE